MITIVDYGMGNLQSVFNAFEYIGVHACLTNEIDILQSASGLVLPGVGAFKDGMEHLKERKLVGVLNEIVINQKKPILGICLGMQLMAIDSTEGGELVAGLSWIDAHVRKFNVDENQIRVPHIGWNDINITKECALFNGIDTGANFYFVHSYCMQCTEDTVIAATCDYGGVFTAAIATDKIMAAQFHPEKSQSNGLKMLSNFAYMCHESKVPHA